MNPQITRILVALSLLGAWGVQPSAAESDGQPNAQTSTKSQTAETQGAKQAVPGKGEATAEEKAAPPKELELVTEAFGIPLGKPFDPAMVAKVISQEEKPYTGREKTKFKGTRYQVEPTAASKDFEKYSVDTTDKGVIYAIHGEYLKAGNEKECKKITKRLAAELEKNYGKPRGKSMLGEWYSFRDMSRKAYRGVRLYANRCGGGRYSIIYSDDQAKKGELPLEPEKESTKERGM